MPSNSSDIIKNDFIKYLDSLGLSPKSHKNYRSDLGHFLSWAITHVRAIGSYVETLTELIPFLSHEVAREYKKFMSETKQPIATINRRLSTLRHLSKFLVTARLIQEDFTHEIENITQNIEKKIKPDAIISDFQAHLEVKKVSKSTIKNYTSDIRQFLTWLEKFNDQSITN